MRWVDIIGVITSESQNAIECTALLDQIIANLATTTLHCVLFERHRIMICATIYNLFVSVKAITTQGSNVESILQLLKRNHRSLYSHHLCITSRILEVALLLPGASHTTHYPTKTKMDELLLALHTRWLCCGSTRTLLHKRILLLPWSLLTYNKTVRK